jgi:hypothetical protein
MFQIENAIISDEIIEKKFVCNLKACKGACCVEGDSGAPLEQNEIEKIEEFYPLIKKFLRPEGIQAIEQNGFYYIDKEHDKVTTLINNKECAYTVFDADGIVGCGIEKAYQEGKINFRKPLSCWLYPIRIREIKDIQAVNYDEWDICKSAVLFGEKHQIKVFEFLKEPLSFKFGEEWYKQLEDLSKIYSKK